MESGSEGAGGEKGGRRGEVFRGLSLLVVVVIVGGFKIKKISDQIPKDH